MAKDVFFSLLMNSMLLGLRREDLKRKDPCEIRFLAGPHVASRLGPNPLTPPVAANWLPHRLAARVC